MLSISKLFGIYGWAALDSNTSSGKISLKLRLREYLLRNAAKKLKRFISSRKSTRTDRWRFGEKALAVQLFVASTLRIWCSKLLNNLNTKISMVSGFLRYTSLCVADQKWKSRGFKSGEWAGQMTLVPCWWHALETSQAESS